MTIQVTACRDSDAVADSLTELLVDSLAAKPDLVLGLPTGGTMIGVYRRLVEAFRRGEVSFRRATSLNVDEYVGLAPDHPRSFAHFMHEHFYRHVDVDPRRRHIPDGCASDLRREARRYEDLIGTLGGFDLLLLGLGGNGHIAFNEPGSSAQSRTRVVRLTPATLAANRRFFACPEEQPGSALTIGIATILAASRIVVVATGAEKSAAVEAMLARAPIEQCPAAALADHGDVRLLLDHAAAGHWRRTAAG